MNSHLLKKQIHHLQPILNKLIKAQSFKEKNGILDSLPTVNHYLSHEGFIQIFIRHQNEESQFVLKSIIAIEQAPIVFNLSHICTNLDESMKNLLEHLLQVERFYKNLGGIIGYHLNVISMICEDEDKKDLEYVKYHHPKGIKIEKEDVRLGIEHLPHVAEIFPVGGSGDRLNLTEELTGIPLPAALLPFLGRTLLEGLIRDHQAREFLYFKLFGKQITTPILMMTSDEKNNHHHILSICESHNWFGRPKESFFFFIQPQVPVVTKEGNWSLTAPLSLTLKPGGHGVIWKLAQEQGAFSWLLELGYNKSIVRQINNPLASLDDTLLALIGYGCKENKALGFVSCERVLNSAEGTNVLIEKKISENENEYCLTNIEYTDFEKRNVPEKPLKEGSPYSTYPANTNILFIDIPSIQQALVKCPIPGNILNMKTQFSYIDPQGNTKLIEGGRLESTMQNIADCFTDVFSNNVTIGEVQTRLKTYILYNKRIKTISSTKKSFKAGESPLSTPEQTYHDLLANHHELLESYCGFIVPKLNPFEDYIQKGPSFIFSYHPALGPLYSIISQKLKGGRLSFGSELILEVTEIDVFDLDLQGSLIIEAKFPTNYANSPCCILERVKVKNKGIDRSQQNIYWKNQVTHLEKMRIVLNEGSEFVASEITFEGAFEFEIPPFSRMVITQDSNGRLNEEVTKISKPCWKWKYLFDNNDVILVKDKINHRDHREHRERK